MKYNILKCRDEMSFKLNDMYLSHYIVVSSPINIYFYFLNTFSCFIN